MLRKKQILIPTLLILFVVIIVIIAFKIRNNHNQNYLTFSTREGPFDICITTTGQLRSENSTSIAMPSHIFGMINVWEVKLSHLIPEGTIVDSGDIVAELDPSSLLEALSEEEDFIQNARTEIENVKADTALELSGLRDELNNSKFDLEDKRFILAQSKYESPAVIKNAENSLARAEIKYQQSIESYKLKKDKSKLKIIRTSNNLNNGLRRKQKILEAMESLKIKAPNSGMIVYTKNFEGNIIKSGTILRIHADRNIALIPDFSSMISETHINEKDISRIKKDLKVEVKVDAFPDRVYSGKVSYVANMGEEIEGFNANMFAINITLDSSDNYLRSGMTTTNKVFINSFENKKYIPLEALFTKDSISYVFLQSKYALSKKQVHAGVSNDAFITIIEGLKKDDKVLLNIPDNDHKLKIVKL